MSTVTLYCAVPAGIVLKDPLDDPLGQVRAMRSPGFVLGTSSQPPVRLNGRNANGTGLTSGVDSGLWNRWSFISELAASGAVAFVSSP